MPMQPNVSSSELNGVSRKRSVSQCRAAPSANMSGTMAGQREQRVHVRHRRKLPADVGGEEGEGEVRQVDRAQQAPAQAEPQPEQAVQRAGEHAGQHRLREQRPAREADIGRQRRDQLGAGRGELRRPHHHPLAVLHLLDAHQVVAVVDGAVEAQRSLDGVDTVLLQPGRPSALSSRLLVAVTAASRICQAVNEAAACTSTEGRGSLALVARSW